MSRTATQERTAVKRRWGAQAIRLAMENRWEKAVEVNENILELFPRDVQSYNRLGRSLTELGRYRDALAAYQASLRLDKRNKIASRNTRRLIDLLGEASVP